MFEKFSALDVDSAGRGGEYAVQAGFGWTNGVLLWVASEYKDVLVKPTCPNITEQIGASNANAVNGAVERIAGRGVLSALVVAVLVMIGMML